jgi:probable HAF family extracellular repeat protein
LPGATFSEAQDINDAGQVVGFSVVGGLTYATEWSDGNVINLDPNSSFSIASAINDAGQVVGQSIVDGLETATEWSGGSVISLGGLPGFTESSATGINDAGQAVGFSSGGIPVPVPEPSTWAMMLAGFAGLGLVGYRRAAYGS